MESKRQEVRLGQGGESEGVQRPETCSPVQRRDRCVNSPFCTALGFGPQKLLLRRLRPAYGLGPAKRGRS